MLDYRHSWRLATPLLHSLLVTALLAANRSPAAPGVTVTTGQIVLPTYPWAAVKHPYFRGTDRVNIYPYPMLDFLSREKTNRSYRTVVLENEFLRITFLPELGGKIHEVIDKTVNQPMFYVNHVVKPGLIAQCGAWTSGGVEWNTGPQGHTVSCMQPVEVLILPEASDGSRSVAVGETERIYGTRWTVVVTLRPGRSFIEERIRIYNPTETIRPYYFWNCTASPNTPGFRFIYPMTLGCDHAGEKFFQWPIDNGKDLTRGTNYQDASSIFAWYCDQDFFGSYNDDLDHGVVSYANHHQLPGKKAWTWGQGGFGRMHQMDLTDDDGPYNEVQTGPLLTQAQVGRLDPCEAVEWNEWWYPIHGIGGFTFANQDACVNATLEGGQLRLRLIGTADWNEAKARLLKDSRELQVRPCKLSARQQTELTFDLAGEQAPFEVEVGTSGLTLARFAVPLALPDRQPPAKPASPQTASELVEAGWQDFLFARFPEAEARFGKALEKDPTNPDAHTGLAYLKLDADPTAAAAAAKAALAIAPNHGRAAYALAVAEARSGNHRAALDAAWKASLEPETAVGARALIGKLLLERQDYAGAIAALSQAGPWRQDSLCRSRLALAALARHPLKDGVKPDKEESSDLLWAADLVRENAQQDPLDSLGCYVGRRTHVNPIPDRTKLLANSIASRQDLLALLAQDSELGQVTAGLATFPESRAILSDPASISPLQEYWLAWSSENVNTQTGARRIATDSLLKNAGTSPSDGVFPYRLEMLPALQWATTKNPKDGKAALYLGHLLFHLGRHAEGREMWKRAAQLDAERVIACRALGMAAKTLDNDLKSARDWLEQANQADPYDAIVARDLANVLFALADKAGSDSERDQLLSEAKDRLQAAFGTGRGRSDFVALLARAQNRLGNYAATGAMLDTVRVTVWEGSHEVHDLYVQAHLAAGEQQLNAGHPAEALAEFNRALEYPANLATGKLEDSREAHIQFQRGNALAALGRKDDAAAAWKLAAAEPESKDTRIQEARQKAKAALKTQ